MGASSSPARRRCPSQLNQRPPRFGISAEGGAPARVESTRSTPWCVTNRRAEPSSIAAQASPSAASNRSSMTSSASPPGGEASSPRRHASRMPGQRVSISARVWRCQAPPCRSRSRASRTGVASARCLAIMSAVRDARLRSEVYAAAKAEVPASERARSSACDSPIDVRGTSSQPCQRPSAFQADSPWRTISTWRTDSE